MPAQLAKIALPTLLVGTTVRFRNAPYQLLEILEHPPAIVLKPIRTVRIIQADVHGRARRHVDNLLSIPLIGPDGGANPDYVIFQEENLALIRRSNAPISST